MTQGLTPGQQPQGRPGQMTAVMRAVAATGPKVLRIGVAFVTAAHVIRYLIVVVFCIPVYHLLERIRAGAGR